jgi:hypothetical protein
MMNSTLGRVVCAEATHEKKSMNAKTARRQEDKE